jgi:CheY-like chemotaxis protein
MAHLLSFIDTRPQFEVPNPSDPPEHSLPPTQSINASSKSALLVENDKSLLNFLRRSLNDDGYVVRTAANSEEGLRLYCDCAPFNVVLIDYCVPQTNGVEIDHCAPLQTNGIALAMAIREINPSQGMIIAALDYQNAEEVPRPPELMHVPVLIDIGNFQLRSWLEKIEVDRAIETLTSSELLRLQQFANFRVRGLGRAARGRTCEDLFQEALLRTLIGAEDIQKGRHWNKDVGFVMHLTGAMHSISNCWKRQFEAAVQRKETEAYLIPALPIHDAKGQEQSPLYDVASGHITSGGLWGTDAAADERLIEKDEEDRVLTIFKDDPEASHVLQGLLEGLKRNAIMPRYGLGEKQYAAAVKRIRMKLLGRKNGGSTGEKHGR